MRDELLTYYERELAYFRKQAGRFSEKYPKIAGRLQLEAEKCEDPHVERMIEAFSFLAARVRLKLDDEFPEITESFLNVLYPHYLAPIPSMSIVQMKLKATQGNLMSGYRIGRGTTVSSPPVQGTSCTFRTCFDTSLWPIEVVSASLESVGPLTLNGRMEHGVVRIQLRCLNDTKLSTLSIGTGDSAKILNSLRFHLLGDAQLVYPLYEILLNHCDGMELVSPPQGPENRNGSNPIHLPSRWLNPAGFGPEEGMLPYSARSFPGYRLLTEYFIFPEKFLFFDVTGLEQAVSAGFGSEFEIRIYVSNLQPPPGLIDRTTFQLGCVPVVNLFRKVAEPIQLHHRQHEYHVIADVHRRQSLEVYSLDNVATVNSGSREIKPFDPFYSYHHTVDRDSTRCFWYANRRLSPIKDDDGTEVYLSLVDLDFSPKDPAIDTLILHLTCSNRDLPSRLPFTGKEGEVEVDGSSAVVSARCLRKFTPSIRPPLRKAAQWRLISHLALNHLSIVGGAENGDPHALREILQLYDFTDSQAIRKQIGGLLKIGSRPVVRQLGHQIGNGFVRGVETTLEFDESQFVGSGVYLFASVLEKFLGLYVSVNSFSQLVARSKQREGDICKWAPRAGNKIIL